MPTSTPKRKAPKSRKRPEPRVVWIPDVPYGEPGSLYHEDPKCEAPYLDGLACPACETRNPIRP